MSAINGILGELYLTRQQLAAELQVTIRSLDRMRALGTAPPCIKIGKRLFFRRDAVMRWLLAKESPEIFKGRRSAKALKRMGGAPCVVPT